AVTRFGAPTDFGARTALKRWGLIPVKDVTIIQLGGLPEAFAALKADSVQAAVLPPPFSTEAKRLGMVELIDFNQSDIEFTGLGLTGTARYMSARGVGLDGSGHRRENHADFYGDGQDVSHGITYFRLDLALQANRH